MKEAACLERSRLASHGGDCVSRTIGSLQAGRGLAALAVVLHHAGLAGHDFGGPFVGYDLFLPGYLGVDYFFVLSGFIIYHSTVGVGRTPADYLSARFRRVYLPYWPVGLTIALLYVLLPTLSQRTTGWSWLPTVLVGSTPSEALCMTKTTPSGEISSYTSVPASKNHVVVRRETVST